ncbi:hypothetical protein [Shewanella sp. UCD-KL12]|uniref:hypothetical protein n=1 Tax=Shewanella sp. UCD-KL12 TaxID=1917163 RepID=UPI00097117B3|nr:hypothetical protein [Shewanella sp. UCD-KL12]
MELISVTKIWDRGEHNAFTDIARFNGALYIIFREGSAHVSNEGALRLLRSDDEGYSWQSVALFALKDRDLRDGKLQVFNQTLLVFGAGPIREPAPKPLQSYCWKSHDGKAWSEPQPLIKEGEWLWRISATAGCLYGVAYRPHETDGYVALYKSDDGNSFEGLVPRLNQSGYVNESGLIFDENHLAHCLLRRDPVWGPEQKALLGHSEPPYKIWQWTELDKRIGGPVSFLYQGRHLAVVRLMDGEVRTSIVEVIEATAQINELLTLPSAGDTSYAGVVVEEHLLKMSYYSSHEGKSAIYFAVVDLVKRDLVKDNLIKADQSKSDS